MRVAGGAATGRASAMVFAAAFNDRVAASNFRVTAQMRSRLRPRQPSAATARISRVRHSGASSALLRIATPTVQPWAVRV